MSVFSFIKESGEKLFGIEKAKAEESNEISDSREAEEQKEDKKAIERLKKRFDEAGLKVDNLEIEIEGDTVILSGNAKDQATREKLVLLIGNSEGIAKVDERLQMTKNEQESVFHTVERDDDLKKIAKDHYGDQEKYQFIVEANHPMLQDPAKIYPGQVLRIPVIENKETV
ncbi:peptidoglycan-binding protein LysM [Autumnicola musiva]|uniref:Peptidoglycan-binding protein LysM n=1 Tax=Autumnicola musiva TaxID=3075589 RepID=A0ABU3D4H5_9FLAO|nr:peptidoglycan-binding protein LysM [Zunongwangia sp. F117]MDT0676438.1 peptidoglycan-binding protein LysM [Zunongwangia sp. F117]